MPILGTLASSVQKITGSFESIATVTATGGETTFTFSNIPQTFDHLQIRGFAQRSGSGSVGIHGLNINGSSNTADYSYHITRTSEGANYLLTTTESTTGAVYDQARSTHLPMSANIANNFGWMIADITGYSGTTKNKPIKTVGGYTYNGTAFNGFYGHVGFASNYYNSTSAITSISVTICGDIFSAGSTYSLYGIKGS